MLRTSVSGQLRLDQWNALKSHSTELATLKNSSNKTDSHKKELSKILENLQVIEQYFVYPGKANVEGLIQIYEQDDFKHLAHIVADVNRYLVSEVNPETRIIDLSKDRRRKNLASTARQRPGQDTILKCCW
ncbi:MAG: hypothetical protein U5L96_06755 [Owenweeksia sp.]|nr:hypothetical protein [Owenweeksia sp.]